MRDAAAHLAGADHADPAQPPELSAKLNFA